MNDATKTRDRFAVLTRLKFEIWIELGVCLVCALLGLALSTKIAVSVSTFCFGFAVPHVVTGILVGKHDPDRHHALALRFFFFAVGFARASVLSIVGVVLTGVVDLLLNPAGNPGLFAVGQVPAAILSGSFFTAVFPLTAIGCWHGTRCAGGVYFISALTRNRQNPKYKLTPDRSKPSSSLYYLAIVSTLSLATSLTILPLFICAMLGPFILPGVAMGTLLLLGFTVPIVWYMFFVGVFVQPWRTSDLKAD